MGYKIIEYLIVNETLSISPPMRTIVIPPLASACLTPYLNDDVKTIPLNFDVPIR